MLREKNTLLQQYTFNQSSCKHMQLKMFTFWTKLKWSNEMGKQICVLFSAASVNKVLLYLTLIKSSRSTKNWLPSFLRNLNKIWWNCFENLFTFLFIQKKEARLVTRSCFVFITLPWSNLIKSFCFCSLSLFSSDIRF